MQRGVAKGIANLGYKKELETAIVQKESQIQVTQKSWKKELETAIAERSYQIQSRKGDPEARDDDKAGNAEKS